MIDHSARIMVHVREDEKAKQRAAKILAGMGISVSDAVRMLLVRVAADRALPFDVKVPNATTVKAMLAAEDGKGKRLNSAGVTLLLVEGNFLAPRYRTTPSAGLAALWRHCALLIGVTSGAARLVCVNSTATCILFRQTGFRRPNQLTVGAAVRTRRTASIRSG